jgi:hypothetical protein
MLLISGGVTSCVVPRIVEYYDEDCRIVARQMEFHAEPGGNVGPCNTTAECSARLASVGVISATSIIISGSIYVVGNVVYWLEKQGNCKRDKSQVDAASQT